MRSIPAWAGQPLHPSAGSRSCAVYPRVGGGNRNRPKRTAMLPGSIPAWAGQPMYPTRLPRLRRVYPRVGGATKAAGSLLSAVEGLSRVGGATGSTDSTVSLAFGLSPRGRGNPAPIPHVPTLAGSIPAWAGQPAVREVNFLAKRSIPRGRGNLARQGFRQPPDGSIPAWAGQPTSTDTSGIMASVYPRVGGATQQGQTPLQRRMGLSPRGRGNPDSGELVVSFTRSIPAWAGQPLAIGAIVVGLAVYPRVGGATTFRQNSRHSSHGLSPRGRGNRRRYPPQLQVLRSIPAWAGQPATDRWGTH